MDGIDGLQRSTGWVTLLGWAAGEISAHLPGVSLGPYGSFHGYLISNQPQPRAGRKGAVTLANLVQGPNFSRWLQLPLVGKAATEDMGGRDDHIGEMGGKFVTLKRPSSAHPGGPGAGP
ncbi:hypothetical protein DSO57_1007570 [Entomophthora muscae]|uniref:Uncharacterized protein n=1 Tax=Entomophthora muscae TaxID=34485 RepID=A0ACC2S9A3_9FUNG|nr:hypothetical protein DSO57_1007570 [Entomophthora muscae]